MPKARGGEFSCYSEDTLDTMRAPAFAYNQHFRSGQSA